MFEIWEMRSEGTLQLLQTIFLKICYVLTLSES